MIGNRKPAATAIAAGSRSYVLSWTTKHAENATARAVVQERPKTPRQAEMLVRFGGQAYLIRHPADDANWRARALARLDPLSDAAFALRKAPQTEAERAAFNEWADAELLHIGDYAP